VFVLISIQSRSVRSGMLLVSAGVLRCPPVYPLVFSCPARLWAPRLRRSIERQNSLARLSPEPNLQSQQARHCTLKALAGIKAKSTGRMGRKLAIHRRNYHTLPRRAMFDVDCNEGRRSFIEPSKLDKGEALLPARGKVLVERQQDLRPFLLYAEAPAPVHSVCRHGAAADQLLQVDRGRVGIGR
jgi:hypothetical protein